jgi:glycosyltransferase involved in cell wall biosynthesis
LHSFSIVVPAFNEERRLPRTLQRLLAFLDSRPMDFAEVVVVDDGSRDRTAALVEGVARRDARVRLLKNPGNRGKGYAIRHGFQEARGQWLLFSDADLSTPIEEVDKLWEAAVKRPALIAIGSRALDRSLVGVHQPFWREWAGKLFNFVMRLITGLPFRDTQCGFKLFKSDAARRIASRQTLEGFGFDVELLFIAKTLGIPVVEVPVRWDDVQGTKVSTLRGLVAFLEPLQIRWNSLIGRYR